MRKLSRASATVAAIALATASLGLSAAAASASEAEVTIADPILKSIIEPIEPASIGSQMISNPKYQDSLAAREKAEAAQKAAKKKAAELKKKLKKANKSAAKKLKKQITAQQAIANKPLPGVVAAEIPDPNGPLVLQMADSAAPAQTNDDGTIVNCKGASCTITGGHSPSTITEGYCYFGAGTYYPLGSGIKIKLGDQQAKLNNLNLFLADTPVKQNDPDAGADKCPKKGAGGYTGVADGVIFADTISLASVTQGRALYVTGVQKSATEITGTLRLTPAIELAGNFAPNDVKPLLKTGNILGTFKLKLPVT